MNGFYLGALIVSFLLLIFLSMLGKGILYHWQTPVSAAAPATITQPLVPVPPAPAVVTTAPVATPATAPAPEPAVVPLSPGSPAVTPVRP